MTDQARVTAYEDALRGIAYAAGVARRQVRGFRIPPETADCSSADGNGGTRIASS